MDSKKARADKSKFNETLAQEWTGLETRWRVCQSATPPPPTSVAKEFNRHLTISCEPNVESAEGWKNFNRAEQLVGQYLTDSQLTIEFASLLDLARSRNLSSLAVHQVNATAFPTMRPEQRRDAYLTLLSDLQSNFVYSRFLRMLNRNTAVTLSLYGFLIVFSTALVSVLSRLWMGEETPLIFIQYLLVPVAAFGCMGAYFSRVISFQLEAKASSITYDSFLSIYAHKVLILRFICGVVGALVFYFLLCSGIVSGSIFPNMTEIEHETRNMAGLFVWSFIAGFSERLVPEALARTEGKAAGGK